MDQQMDVSGAVKKRLNQAIALVKALYDKPELPYHELESSKAIVEVLRKAGFEVEYPFMEKELGYATAFRAMLKNGEGPCVALLTEYDALPGLGHGCGHNLHGPLSVLSGLALLDLQSQFSGTVYVIGTPAEEENGAKITMAQSGLFDGMALATMMHSWSGGFSQPEMDVLSLRCYVVEFFGRESHAVAAPWKAHSALAAARKFLDVLDARRECFTSDVFINSIIQEGGKSPNIIPEYAKIRMEFRTSSRGRLQEIDRIVQNCANGIALAMDCQVKLTFGLQDFWDMVRVDVLENEVTKLLGQYGEQVAPAQPASGSSDVGNVSYHCPTIQPLLSITDEPYGLHTVQLREATLQDRAHLALEHGACVLAELALRVLQDEAFRTSVYREFQAEKERKLHETV